MQLNIVIDNINNTCINNPIFIDDNILKNKTLTLYVNKTVYNNKSNIIIDLINNNYLVNNYYEKLFLDSMFLEKDFIENFDFKNIKVLEFRKGKILDEETYEYLKNIPKIYVDKVTYSLLEKDNLYHSELVNLESNLLSYNITYKNLKERNYIVISSPINGNNFKDLELIFKINPNIIEVDFSFSDSEKYMESIDNILKVKNNISKIKLKNNISKNNLNIFKSIQNKYKNINFEISYIKELYATHSSENDTICTLSEYINMEEILNMYVCAIKKHNYSPFEQVLYAYDISKSYEYIMENIDENPEISRQLHTSIYGEKIVCVGYASIFNAILSKLNIPCANYGTNVYDDNNFEAHERSVIYLKDQKYNIDGIFVCDPTWDRRRENDNDNPLDRYTYFMINPNDVTNFNLNEDLNGISIIHYFKNNLKYDHNALTDFIEIYDKLFNTNYKDDYNIEKYIENFINKSNDRVTYSMLLKAIINIRKKEEIYNSHEKIKSEIKKLIQINKIREVEQYQQNSEIISKKNKKITNLENSEKIYRFTKKHF